MVIRWFVLTVAIIIASYLLDGIRVSGLSSAFFAAAVLGLLNVSIRPLLILLTLPINILSLGLVTFLINALMLKIVSAIIPGFDVHGFWTAIVGSLIISAVSGLLNLFIRDINRDIGAGNKPDYIDMNRKEDGRWE
ncbi:MAG: phage holin family protein [Deltaproteobacteria bacterium]|nr:phage holin family protein [Deltaproteobacteria bacterium]